jgi:ATP-dependent HslUV protease ATP-binding subunit HslU
MALRGARIPLAVAGRLLFQRVGAVPSLSRGMLLRSVHEAAEGETLAAPSDFGGPRDELSPQEVVARLDDYIVGQGDAKRAIAIALRNRWRRMRVRDDMREEIMPKNILMIGPTGCGKTEISRRLAKFANAPFVKVEATKFTEVGYHGRDVDTIVRDLVEASATLVKELRRKQLEEAVDAAVEEQLVAAIAGGEAVRSDTVESVRKLLRSGAVENRTVMVDVPEESVPDSTISLSLPGGQSIMLSAADLFSRMGRRSPQKTRRQRVKVSEARDALREAEFQKRLQTADVKRDAVRLAEEHGIVVIDEIDKIVADPLRMSSSDASDEGVQRDLLPLLEGTTIKVPKFGDVRTDHVLFVCSGAFHSCKPADMLAELQGRLPIRVELKGLTAEDMYRILTEPKANLLEQQKALLGAEGVILEFDDEAVREIANRAAELNKSVENIGARRLNTVIERVMDDISFDAADNEKGSTVLVTKAMVDSKLAKIAGAKDLKKFVI